MVFGRIIEGRVLELYEELADSPAKALEEKCVLSAIFALRYLSRDIAANVEPIDASSLRDFAREVGLMVRIFSIGGMAMNRSGGQIHLRSSPPVPHRIHITRRNDPRLRLL